MKKSKEIKAILFDMGGVIIDLDPQACKDNFKRILGFDRIDELLDACHQKGIIGDMEAGKLDENEFRRIVLSESREGATSEDVDFCLQSILLHIKPEKMEFLKELGGQYDLYMLTNNNEITWKRCKEIFVEAGGPVDTLFRKIFISCRMKILKPQPEIFIAARDGIGLPMENIMFIDDSPFNAAAASSLGMKGVHYPAGSDLRALIENAL